MTKRLAELVIVLSLVAIFGWLFGPKRDQGLPPPIAASPTGQKLQLTRTVPAFELPGAFGGAYRFGDIAGSNYASARGPLFITLTAIGCGDCQARIPTDQRAYGLAHSHGMLVWNILVFANTADQGRDFVSRFHPTADSELVDPGGRVSVNQLGGSDAACWILIDKNNHIAWQGGGDLHRLEEELSKLP